MKISPEYVKIDLFDRINEFTRQLEISEPIPINFVQACNQLGVDHIGF